MRIKKNLMAMVMALALTVSCVPTAFAANVTSTNGTGETPVTITAEATTFSVTVPTSIAIQLKADGTVTCPTAEAVKITNNSAGPVKVTKIQMNKGTWKLADYNGGVRTAIAAAGVDSKLLGFQMVANGDTIATNGTSTDTQVLTHDASKWVINGKDAAVHELSITCSAIASAVSAAISTSETAASVVFTIAWNS